MRHLCPALTLIALSLASPPTDAREPRRIVPSQQVEAQPDFVEQAHIHRLRAIKQLRGLPNPGLDPDVKSEMMHRLAELYIEEARYWYFNEMEGESEDHTESRKWTQAAVRLYERIGSEHPTFSRGDEAAWYLSIAYDELDRPQDALQARIDLVRDFPGSDFAASAYVQIGEHHFDRNDAYKALLAYKHATEIPGHDKVDYARYKLGWCYYNVGEYDQAIVMMRAVASRPPATETGAIQLAEEAQRDLVRFYIDTERIDEAIATIDSLPLQPTETARLMARMAEQLTESGLFTDSARVWKILLSRDPLAAEAPRYLDEVVALHQQVGDQAALRESLARSASLFNRDSTWHRTHADSPDILQHTLDLRESRTRKLALTLHEQARKTQDREQLAQAGDLYAAWLSEFDGLVEEPDVRFAYGELLYSQGRYSESFAEYTAVVDLDPKGRHARFCAEAAIHAAQKVIAAQPDADGPLTSAERNLLAAADRFLAMFPNDKLAQNVTYQTAYLLYGRDQLDEATARFRQVITMDPTTADAIRGADLLEDSLALAGQWDLLQETALEFYNLEGLGDSAFKADTWKVYERASFKRIEAKLTEDGDGVAAAEAWVAFADEFPTAEIADLALNNAAVNFHTAGLIRSAMDAQEALITRHPTSSYVPDQMAALGFNCETIADFEAAAHWYEALHAATPDHPSAPDALYSAAVFRRSMGELSAALADTRALADAQDPRASGLLIDLGRALEAAEQWEDAAALYGEFADSPPAHATPEQHTFARLASASTAQHLGRQAEAEAIWQALLDDGVTGEVFAEAAYSLLVPRLSAYQAMRIDGVQRPGQPRNFDQRLQRQLKEKTAAFQVLQADLAVVIDAGSLRWGLAAFVDLGEAYEDMATALLAAPVPTNLTPEQLEMYEDRIKDYAYTQEQRAIEAYSLVMTRSMQVRSYDESTATALGRLEVLDPTSWPGLSEDLIRAGFTTGSGYGVGIMDQPE